MKNIDRILAIETSCDETAASVIDASGKEPVILSNIVSSQIDLHKLTGGVVPEVAARAHLESINAVINQALSNAKTMLSEIDAIAVTNGPGLIGALLIGFNTAKTLAYTLDIPIIPINHIEGHIYSTSLNRKQELENKSSNDGQFPVLALTVSGGHTSLTLVKDHGSFKTIGETVDDAAGEAFDKVAKLLDLGYPGGPIVSKLAEKKETASFKLPRPMINSKDFNFSFSGLKTAVLHKVRELTEKHGELTKYDQIDICTAFEEAVVDVLCSKTLEAAKKYRPKGILLAGGVSANKHLQNELKNRIEQYNQEETDSEKMNFYTPSADMTGDNAAMIGIAAFYRLKYPPSVTRRAKLGHPELVEGSCSISSWDKVSVDSNLRL